MGEEIQHDDYDGRNQSVIPVIPRLDRLDSLVCMIKYLQGKEENSSCWGTNRPCIPIDFALRETQDKGSILDRLSSLENRLFQLCLELEATNASTSSMAYTSENTSSSRHGSSTDRSLSMRSLDERCLDDHPRCFHQALFNRFEFLGNSVNHRMDNTTQLNPLLETTTNSEGAKKSKKSRFRRWKRLMGC